MIEVVPNSSTVAKIQKDAGGATAAFKQTPLMNWLRESHTEEEFETVVDNFTRSCAGYVVGTYPLVIKEKPKGIELMKMRYILGIGDRHNDNIMVCKSGHIFHIDFGHFLGIVSFCKLLKTNLCYQQAK